MDCHEFFGFVGILRESIRVMPKNGKRMAAIATISILLNSLLIFTEIISTKPVVRDLLAKETLLSLMSPKSPDFADLLADVKVDVRIILGVESALLLASLIVFLFSMVATILVSATAYCGSRLSFKDFLARLPRSCVRPIITSFYITLSAIGYFILFLVMLVPVLVTVDDPSTLTAIITLLGVLAIIFLFYYFYVVWVLALVISVMEENCYGIEALRKAGQLVEGKRLHGFGLNFLYVLAGLIVAVVSGMSRVQKSLWVQMSIMFLLTVVGCLVTMLKYISYTVLYFQCKKTHGEEIELIGSMEYIKVPTTPLVTEDIP